jgi:hypothetical protein
MHLVTSTAAVDGLCRIAGVGSNELPVNPDVPWRNAWILWVA